MTPPAVEQFLCSDRIRYVMAVDDAYDQNFFVATFGLEPYEYSTTPSTPRGIEALLIRFKVRNGIWGWYIDNRMIINMNQEHLNLTEDCLSSYNASPEYEEKL